MNIKKIFYPLLFSLVVVLNSYSQEENFKELVINQYVSELKLSEETEKQFGLILEKYKPLFKNEFSSSQEYNALLKREVLEIYEILDKNQFNVYKKIKKFIEPNKKYRTKG